MSKGITWSKQNEKVLYKLMDKYELVQKSPYSDSFYSEGFISWEHKPEGSYRLADHWNFESDGKLHCRTTKPVQPGKWYVGRYSNGMYTIIEEANIDYELESRIRNRQLELDEKKRVKIRAEINRQIEHANKMKEALRKGGYFEIEYTTYTKRTRQFMRIEHREICYCDDKWAYTSTGKHRVFEVKRIAKKPKEEFVVLDKH